MASGEEKPGRVTSIYGVLGKGVCPEFATHKYNLKEEKTRLVE